MNRNTLAWLVGMALLLVIGCAVDQAREVQTYRKVLDAGQTQPPAPFFPDEPVALKRALALADAHRQDLQAAGTHVKAVTERLEAAWGGYFPSVSLNLTRYLYRESFPDDVDWTGLIQVNLPIFSAGLVHAEVRTVYSHLRQAHLLDIRLTPLPPGEGGDPASRDAGPSPIADTPDPP